MSHKTKKDAMFESLGQNILVSHKESSLNRPPSGKSWELSPVRQVSISDFLDHPDNVKYFEYWDKAKKEDELQWSRFVEQIRKSGIHDPLIVFGPKASGSNFSLKPNTLITGHRRKKALLELGQREAPVRFIEGKISLRELEVLMLSDNFDRRQIKDPAQIIYLLVNLFPDTFQKDNRGGKPMEREGETLAEISKTHGISIPQLKRYKAVYREATKLAAQKKRTYPGPEEFKLALKNLANQRKTQAKVTKPAELKTALFQKLPFLSEKLSVKERSLLIKTIESLI